METERKHLSRLGISKLLAAMLPAEEIIRDERGAMGWSWWD